MSATVTQKSVVLRGGYDGDSVVGPLDAVPQEFPKETTTYDYNDDSDLEEEDERETFEAFSDKVDPTEPEVCSSTSSLFTLSHPSLPSLQAPRSRSRMKSLLPPDPLVVGWEQPGKPS